MQGLIDDSNEFILPGGCMRYSLFEAWRKSKTNAMRTYFPENEEDRYKFSTKWVSFGAMVADDLSKEARPEYLKDVYSYRVPEYRLIVNIDGFMIRGTIDSFEPETKSFLDHKCSKIKWTKADVLRHEQLAYYSVLIEEQHGYVNNLCKIVNIPVEEDAETGLIRRTGEAPIIIDRTITQEERVRMRKLMVETAREISDAYKKYLAGEIVI